MDHEVGVCGNCGGKLMYYYYSDETLCGDGCYENEDE